MSEFHIKYAVEGKGNRTRDKRVNMYFFQDYRAGGVQKVQVVVPWQDDFGYLICLHSAFEIDVPMRITSQDIASGAARVYSRADYMKEGCFFLENELSGTGVFGFSRDGVTPPETDVSYAYSYSILRKSEIRYQITESKRSILVDLHYPPLLKPLALIVHSKKNSKPLERMQQSMEKGHILLKADWKRYTRVRIPVDGAEKDDYRLFFKHPEDGDLFILSDESRTTLEEREQQKTVAAKRSKENEPSADMESRSRKKSKKGKLRFCGEHTPVVRCPYCFNELKTTAKTLVGAGVIARCNSEEPVLVDKTAKALKGNFKRLVYCGENYAKDSNTYSNLILPESFHKERSMIVTLIGETNSGKSLLLSQIADIGARLREDASKKEEAQKQGESSEARKADGEVVLESSILNMIAKGFSKNGDVTPLPLQRLNMKPNATPTSDTDVMLADDSGSALLRKYVVKVGEALPTSTNTGEDMRKLIYHPVAFHMGGLGNLYLYDVPGEAVQRDDVNTKELRTIFAANCLILLINGYSPSNLAASIGFTANVVETISHYMSADKMNEIPVAVVLAKMDMLEHRFDPNCHILRQDIPSLIAKASKRYDESLLQRHVDLSSYEIEHYLRAQQNGEGFINMIKGKFRYHKFFALSSLGTQDCVEETDGTAVLESRLKTQTLLFRPHPKRVELPLIWLMYQMGLIKA